MLSSPHERVMGDCESRGGMDEIEEFFDDRQRAWCVHCGAWIADAETNWDHVPSKSLLDRPLPAHVPQVEICRTCNSGFSLDEEYLVAFLSCVLAGSTDPDAQENPRVQRALARNPALHSRIESSKRVYSTLGGEERVIWEPETERIHRIVLKNARGHAFFEFGEPMLQEPDHVWAMPLESMTTQQRVAFDTVGAGEEFAGWAEVGSRMMTRQVTGQDMDSGWVIAQPCVYRYAVFQNGTITVRSVIREYLATEAFWS
jgi:hypothetical protein